MQVLDFDKKGIVVSGWKGNNSYLDLYWSSTWKQIYLRHTYTIYKKAYLAFSTDKM